MWENGKTQISSNFILRRFVAERKKLEAEMSCEVNEWNIAYLIIKDEHYWRSFVEYTITVMKIKET